MRGKHQRAFAAARSPHVLRLVCLAAVLSFHPAVTDASVSPGDAESDSTLTFRRSRITLTNGEILRSPMVRITGDSLVMYESHYIPTEALIQLRSTKIAEVHEMSEVAQLEVGRNYAGLGAGIGFLGGGIAMLALMSTSEGGDYYFTFEAAALLVGMAGGIGAGVGAITGSFFHHWESVYEPGADLDVYRIKYKRGVGYDLETPSADE